jgi:hypothetical protein
MKDKILNWDKIVSYLLFLQKGTSGIVTTSTFVLPLCLYYRPKLSYDLSYLQTIDEAKQSFFGDDRWEC